MHRSTEINSIEIREGWKGYYLFGFVLWMGIISYTFINPDHRQDSINFFFKDLTFVKIPVFIILLGIPGLCLYHYFGKRLKLKIDSEGIWKRKHTTISWNEISGFSSKENYAQDGSIYKMIFTLKDETNHTKKKS